MCPAPRSPLEVNKKASLLPPSLLQLASEVYDGKDVLERSGKMPVGGSNEGPCLSSCVISDRFPWGTREEQAAEWPWQLRLTQGSLSNFSTSGEPFMTHEGLSQPSH